MTDAQIIAELEEKVKILEEKLERKERQYKNLEAIYNSTIAAFESLRFIPNQKTKPA